VEGDGEEAALAPGEDPPGDVQERRRRDAAVLDDPDRAALLDHEQAQVPVGRGEVDRARQAGHHQAGGERRPGDGRDLGAGHWRETRGRGGLRRAPRVAARGEEGGEGERWDPAGVHVASAPAPRARGRP
jgi:hypothetical protein